MTTFITQMPVACTAVLHIDGLPRQLRPVVEDLMVECIPSPAELEVPGVDPMDATWFTQWERSKLARGTVCTRQVLSGRAQELAEFAARMAELQRDHGFQLHMRIVD